MNKKELSKKSTSSLNEEAKEKKIKLFNLRFKNATGELKDTSQIRKTRKEIARILTELNERKIKKTIDN